MAIPASPTNVVVSSITSTTATISWDQSVGTTGYNVYDKDDNVVTNLTGIESTSYDLINLLALTAYAYKVSAINNDGESDKVVVTFCTLETPPENISLSNMEIGDYIPCRYTATSGIAGSFSELGTCEADEISVSGTDTPDGKFNFVKVAKGTLVADRNLQTGVSWNILNSAKLIEGTTGAITSVPTAVIRSLSGGNSYLSATQTSSTTDSSLGSFPPNNEYDQYIQLSTLDNKITAGDNNVWNYSGISSWVQETPITTIGSSSNRVYRGNTLLGFGQQASSTVNATTGFRPVLIYDE